MSIAISFSEAVKERCESITAEEIVERTEITDDTIEWLMNDDNPNDNRGWVSGQEWFLRCVLKKTDYSLPVMRNEQVMVMDYIMNNLTFTEVETDDKFLILCQVFSEWCLSIVPQVKECLSVKKERLWEKEKRQEDEEYEAQLEKLEREHKKTMENILMKMYKRDQRRVMRELMGDN